MFDLFQVFVWDLKIQNSPPPLETLWGCFLIGAIYWEWSEIAILGSNLTIPLRV
jgi:hypothetical protein